MFGRDGDLWTPNSTITVPSRFDDNAMYAMKATQAPRIPWDKFLSKFVWKQGEHLALIGPTGQGKTTLLARIAPLHPYVVLFVTKPRDETAEHFVQQGYEKLERWVSLDAKQFPRRVLWPNATSVDSRRNQYVIFRDAFDRIFLEGGWTVLIDETWYFVNMLKGRPGEQPLSDYIKLYLLQARSLHISVVNASQRPAFIPLEIYDQSTHLFFFRDNDESNLRRLSGIGWRSATLIKSLIADLESYQFLYVNTRTGEMLRSRCPEVKFRKKGG